VCALACLAAPCHAASLTCDERLEKIPVRVVQKFAVPAGYHEGLYYDGTDMWLANGRCGKIWVIDLWTGKDLKTLDPIGTFTEGITRYDDSRFFISDWDDRKVYLARREGDRFVVEKEASFAPAHPAGVIWTGSRLYMIAWTRGLGTKFELVEMDASFTVLNTYRIRNIHEPSQLAWDGKDLWISSWYSKAIYRVDPSRMKISGSFPSPVPLPTGIVWDGNYMWLTGTYSDLYQLEIMAGEAPPGAR